MTVAELIKEFKDLPQNMPVMVRDGLSEHSDNKEIILITRNCKSTGDVAVIWFK